MRPVISRRCAVWPALAAVVALSVSARGAAGAGGSPAADTVWMSPEGTDGSAGTHENPVLTLARAQEMLRARHKDADAYVLIMSTRGTYVDQTVEWNYCRPSRSIHLQAYPATVNACFVASDADPPVPPFFTLDAAPGEPTNLRIAGLTIRNYVSMAIYFRGDWSSENRWNGGNVVSGCLFQNIGNERLPGREVAYGVIVCANSRRNVIENCVFIECANTDRPPTEAERMKYLDIQASSAQRAAEVVLPVVGIYLAFGSDDNLVIGCTMRRLKGDGIRIRDGSDRNVVQHCDFYETGWSAPCTMWYCDCARENCIKPTLECHSVDNQFIYNRSVGGWGCEDLPLVVDLVPRTAANCSDQGDAPRIVLLGNVQAPCAPADGSKSDPRVDP